MNIVGLPFERFNIIRIFPCAFYDVENGQRETNDRGIFLYYFFFPRSCNWFLCGFFIFYLYRRWGSFFFFFRGGWGRVSGYVYGVVESLWFLFIYFYKR